MQFVPDMESIRGHQVPTWYEDCKLGIFIHWGPYSVPAWAPPTVPLGDIDMDEGWFCNNPYAEWYLNSVRVGKGPTYDHHLKTYGAGFSYENFTDMWKAEQWDPAAWADLFARSGAQYIIPVTKHHDGFCLWDSDYTDYNTYHRGPRRDIIKELSQAVRGAGMRFGVYYSGIIDWRFTNRPMYTGYDVNHPDCIGYDYADYAYNQAMELINKYEPSVLWNDIGWPYKGEKDLPYLFSYYYNKVEEGVVDDRWNGLWHDFTTKEYNAGIKTVDKKWECCRGLGLSFGYNQIEEEKHIIGANELVSLLIDTVAYNGNLLINIGPEANGIIPDIQQDRLLYMGHWLQGNGEAIYGTRPYTRQLDEIPTGEKIYYTAKNGDVYAFIDEPKAGDSTVKIPGFGASAGTCTALGGANLAFAADGGDLAVSLRDIPANAPAVVLKVGK